MICKKCHRALGVNLRFKTTTCPYCNMKTKITPGELRFKTDSEKELSEIISKINHQLQATDEHASTISYPDFGTVVIGSGDQIEGPEASKIEKSVYEQLDPFKRIAIKFRNGKHRLDSTEFLIMIVEELGKELGEFTSEDFKELLNAFEIDIEIEKSDKYLDKLKNLNVIYEPRGGRYRLMNE